MRARVYQHSISPVRNPQTWNSPCPIPDQGIPVLFLSKCSVSLGSQFPSICKKALVAHYSKEDISIHSLVRARLCPSQFAQAKECGPARNNNGSSHLQSISHGPEKELCITLNSHGKWNIISHINRRTQSPNKLPKATQPINARPKVLRSAPKSFQTLWQKHKTRVTHLDR